MQWGLANKDRIYGQYSIVLNIQYKKLLFLINFCYKFSPKKTQQQVQLLNFFIVYIESQQMIGQLNISGPIKLNVTAASLSTFFSFHERKLGENFLSSIIYYYFYQASELAINRHTGLNSSIHFINSVFSSVYSFFEKVKFLLEGYS